MILLDTHVWLWWAAGQEGLLSKKAKQAIEAAQVIGICPMSIWEIAQLVAKKRLGLDRDVRIWVQQALMLPKVKLFQLLPEILLNSVLHLEKLHKDPADRMIVATAQYHQIALLSKDREIKKHSQVKTIW